MSTKYFARVWIVEIPGNIRSEKDESATPIPNSSKTFEAASRSITVLTLSRCSEEKSIQPIADILEI